MSSLHVSRAGETINGFSKSIYVCSIDNARIETDEEARLAIGLALNLSLKQQLLVRTL